MKKQFLSVCVIFSFIVAVLVCCSGCETCKGVGRDIKKADDWFKDNAW